VKCARAQSPTNGQVHGADYTYGAVVTFSCLKGFHLEGSLTTTISRTTFRSQSRSHEFGHGLSVSGVRSRSLGLSVSVSCVWFRSLGLVSSVSRSLGPGLNLAADNSAAVLFSASKFWSRSASPKTHLNRAALIPGLSHPPGRLDVQEVSARRKVEWP